MSAYAAQMTHANLMNYDIFGDWSPAPGPNAPLGTLGCILAVDGSQVPCLKAPPCLPLYGYVLNSTNTGDFTSPGSVPDCQDSAASVSSGPVRGANKTPAEIPQVGPGSSAASIVSSGALVKNSNGTKDMQEPEVSRWTVVSYDDTSSLTDKAAFAKSNGSHLIKSVSSLRAFF
ncbi:hypothetical protein B0H14DRAFT_3547376 [Mycena olivaceomarginata]|nr:hypothetical protein B0H14DRAFT_3547376 [Mycena olivaceomarginata]